MADDNISRQVVIDALHGYFDGMLETDTWSPCDVYGLIETLPSAQTVTPCHLGSPCEYQNPDAKMASAELPDICVGDIISRQAAIDACLKGKTEGLPATNVACDCCAERIRVLPPTERKGHWINRNGNNIYPFWERYKCSVCGGNSNNSDYCPNCGARMESE